MLVGTGAPGTGEAVAVDQGAVAPVVTGRVSRALQAAPERVTCGARMFLRDRRFSAPAVGTCLYRQFSRSGTNRGGNWRESEEAIDVPTGTRAILMP